MSVGPSPAMNGTLATWPDTLMPRIIDANGDVNNFPPSSRPANRTPFAQMSAQPGPVSSGQSPDDITGVFIGLDSASSPGVWFSPYDDPATNGAAGRPVATVSALGYYTTTVYDSASQRVAMVDALGHYSSTVFSPNGSTIAVQNQLGYLTSFILDSASRRICVMDANGGRSTSIYSNRGLVIATQDPLGALTSFTQDANRNAVLRVDGRNWPATYTVDPLNRTAGTLYIDGTAFEVVATSCSLNHARVLVSF